MTDRCVYLHRDEAGHIFYVGMGTLQRAHSRHSRNKGWYKNVFENDNKFDVEIFERNLTSERAAIIEQEVIAALGIETLANRSIGGECAALGMKHTEDTKRRISENSASRRPEHRARLSKVMSGCGNPMYGQTHNAVARSKIAAARMGSQASNETKQKMSDMRKGIRNHSYSHTLHRFRMGECVIEITAYNFRLLTGCSQSLVSMLIGGKRKSAKAWQYEGVAT